jgi:hypothetical protein
VQLFQALGLPEGSQWGPNATVIREEHMKATKIYMEATAMMGFGPGTSVPQASPVMPAMFSNAMGLGGMFSNGPGIGAMFGNAPLPGAGGMFS